MNQGCGVPRDMNQVRSAPRHMNQGSAARCYINQGRGTPRNKNQGRCASQRHESRRGAPSHMNQGRGALRHMNQSRSAPRPTKFSFLILFSVLRAGNLHRKRNTKKHKISPSFSNRKWGLESDTLFGSQTGPTANTTYSYIFKSMHKTHTIPLVRRRTRGSGDRVSFGLQSRRCRISTS